MSTDYVNDRRSGIVDAPSTQVRMLLPAAHIPLFLTELIGHQLRTPPPPPPSALDTHAHISAPASL